MKITRKSVAISGAGGFLGTALANHLARSGWEVIGLVRDPSKYPAKQHITYRAYDLTQAPNPHVLSGAEYFVHAAYVKQSRTNSSAYKTNLEAAKKLLALSRKQKIKKNVFISSMSAHNTAISEYGKQKFQIEKLFNTAADINLRPGLIIGRGGIVKSMSDFIASKHVVPLVDGGKQPLQIIAINELVTAIEKALLSKAGGTLTVANPTVYTYKSFYSAIARQLKTFIFFIPIPYTLLSTAFKVTSLLRLPLSVGEDNLKGLKMLRSVDTTADLKKLGISASDLETALEKI